jgi:single-stranded-DNA-specific exonuclease
MTLTVAEHLVRLGHGTSGEALGRTERYVEPRLRDLTSPDAMADRKKAAARLAQAVRSQEPICVFGDYDCDGITSAAILSDVLEALGGRVTARLASRFDGGYGVSRAALEGILATRPRLLVTCDCGSSDHETLAEAVAHGIDVIVIDHHLVPERPLPALAFLNPHRPECGFPYKGLASCGLVLSLAAALRQELGAELDVRRWLDLVAIGSVADVAPLDGDNRALVQAGLKVLRQAERPGVRALLELCNIDAASTVTAEDVAFRIAPRLNAPGRLQAPDVALALLRAKDPEEARALAAQIEQLSSARRELQNQMIEEALAEVRREGWHERPGVVVGRQGWNHGIVGIVAGRLADELRRPVAVVGFDGATGRGSLRGPAGARLFDALERVADVLERFGGHQAAAGFEVRFERFSELRERFESACAQLTFDAGREELPPLPLVAGDDPSHVLRDLYRLEPWGERNPAPALALEGQLLSAREVRGGHLKLELELPGGRRIGGFGAHLGDRAGQLQGRVRVIGSLRPDRWRGGEAVEILVRALERCPAPVGEREVSSL